MRRHGAALVALLLALPGHAAERNLRRAGGGGSSMVMSLPLSSTGAMLEEDAGTVAHVYWDGAQILDTRGNAWTQVGTVPQVAANVSPFIPGKAGATFSSTDAYYSLGSGSDVLDFSGSWYACFVYTPTSTLATRMLAFNGAYNVNGWSFADDGRLYVSQAGSVSTAAGSTPSVDGPNVTCGGFDAGTGKAAIKTSLGGYVVAGTAVTQVPATTLTMTLGKQAGDAIRHVGGHLHEAIFVAGVAPSDTIFTRQMQRAFGMLGSKGEAISVTRATTATYEANGSIWTAPAGVLRIESNGALSESARTNQLLSSGTVTTGSAINANWLDTGGMTYSTQGAALDGAGTWGRVTSSTVGGATYQTRGVASTTTITSSVWAKADTGTDTVSIQASCQSGTNAGCACGRSDGGSTTARPGVTATYHCTCDANNITTTPVRIWATATCDAAKTAVAFAITPGSYNAATGTADFFGAQLEAGPYPTSYIPTGGTAVARNADVVSVPLPAGLTIAPFLFRYTGAPALRTWGLIAPYLFDTTNAGEASAFIFREVGAAFRVSSSTTPGLGATAWSYPGGYTSGSAAHDFAVGMGGGGVGVLYADGVSYAPTLILGVEPNPLGQANTRLLLGSAAGGGVGSDSYYKNLRLCRSSILARCK